MAGGTLRDEGPLVGRALELEALGQAAGRVAAGASAVVAITGEPGIGKTRLLTELRRSAEATGWLVAEGRAVEFAGDFSFGVFVDALDTLTADLPPAALEPAGSAALGELAALFPSVRAPAAPVASGLVDERFRAHHAVRVLLERIAARRPLVLALDDVHWADAASVELLVYLLARRPRAQVLLALALRSGQAPERLARAVASTGADPDTWALRPARLTRAETAALLGVDAGDARAEHAWREGGGVPFYVEQLARGGAGEALAAAVAGELERLPGDARDWLTAAAVAGEPFDPTLVDVIAAPSASPLDALVTADLIRATSDDRRFAFRHPILRRTVYDGLPETRRRNLHRRAADALAARGAGAPARAHHLTRCADPGDEDAIATLAAAASAAAQRAPGVAAGFYRAALDLLPAHGPAAARRLELLVPLAMALGTAGDLAASRATLEEVAALLGPDAAPLRARVVAFMAMIDHLGGEHARARALLRRALDDLPDQHVAEAVETKLELAGIDLYGGDGEAPLRWTREAAADARALGDDVLLGAATTMLAIAEYFHGDLPAARERFTEGIALADRHTDLEIARRPEMLMGLGWCACALGDYRRGESLLSRGLDVARASGQGHQLVPLTAGRAYARAWLGRLADAAADADDALDMARLADNAQALAWAGSIRCFVAVQAGDLELAVAVADEGGTAAADFTALYGQSFRAQALIESGEPRRARDQLLAAAGGPDLPRVERAWRPGALELLAAADIARGDLAAARSWADAAVALVDHGVDIPIRRAEALRARAMVDLHRDAASAARDALESARLAAGAGALISAARSRTLAGLALAATGERDRAAAELEEAWRVLDECEAVRYRDAAARELRRLGRRPPRRGPGAATRLGVADLSSRENEVARLVAQGRTNRAIAGDLHLSEKTIETHLSRIYRKLGVHTRAELAVVVERDSTAGG